MKPMVLVYRDRLTQLSERFILLQGESLARYQAHYVGVRRDDAVETPPDRTTVLCDGSVFDRGREVAFKLFRVVPRRLLRLRKLAPALVHAHFGPDGVRAIPLAAAMRAPLVVTFHGFDGTMTDEAMRSMDIPAIRQFPSRRPELIRRADRFVAVSDFMARQLVAQGFPAEKVTRHYIGIDVDAFRDIGLTREPVVLFVGRMLAQKGIADFVRAIAEVQRQGFAVRGVAIGDGADRHDAEQLARSLGAAMEFLGAQPAHVVQHWMQRSLIFCLPSRRMPNGWQEGFGLVFAEAQASGLPVVSYANGGIPEVVPHGATGLLAPDGDWRQIGHHIAALIRDHDMRRVFVREGQSRVRARFNLKVQTHALEIIYDAVREQYSQRKRAAATAR